jgi:hypothetical protein
MNTKKIFGLGVSEACVAIFILLFVVGAGSYYTWSERVATEAAKAADEAAQAQAIRKNREAEEDRAIRETEAELNRLRIDAELREAIFKLKRETGN